MCGRTRLRDLNEGVESARGIRIPVICWSIDLRDGLSRYARTDKLGWHIEGPKGHPRYTKILFQEVRREVRSWELRAFQGGHLWVRSGSKHQTRATQEQCRCTEATYRTVREKFSAMSGTKHHPFKTAKRPGPRPDIVLLLHVDMLVSIEMAYPSGPL
jgi:hypothetical protein